MAQVLSPTMGEGSLGSNFPRAMCTPLCPGSKCPYKGQHHLLILSLLKCTNGLHPLETGFRRCLDTYKKAKWFLRSPVPEKSDRLQFPLVHWATMLGKYKVLEHLVTQRGFDLSVKASNNQQGALHSLIIHFTSCLQAKTSHKFAADTFGKVFDVFLKYKTEAIRETDQNSLDTILHICARRCSSDGFASSYLRVMLGRIKECDNITDDERREILTAVNMKGDTFLHMLVVDERSVDTLVYVVENFAEVCDQMSKTKNKVGKTPRQIAVERQSIEILKALKAPDMVLNSLAKAVKNGKNNVSNHSLKKTLQARKSHTGTEVQQNTSPSVLLGDVPSSLGDSVPSHEANSSRSQEQRSQLSDKENEDQDQTNRRVRESPSIFEDPATQNGTTEQPSEVKSENSNQFPPVVCQIHGHLGNIKEEAEDPTSPIIAPVTDSSDTFSARHSTTLTSEVVSERSGTTAMEQLRTDEPDSSKRPHEKARTSQPCVFSANVKEEPNEVFSHIEVPLLPLGKNRDGPKEKGLEGVFSYDTADLASIVADVARQKAAFDCEENAARSSVLGGNLRNVFSAVSNLGKRSAPGTCGVRQPNKKRTRLVTVSSDSDSDADLALDDDSDDESDSGGGNGEEKDEEEDDEDDDEEDDEKDEAQRVSAKHTPFCSKTCDVQHHKLLLGLMKCSNYHYGSAYVNAFMEQVDEYVNQAGRFPEARANGDIPDPISSFKYPLVHWACVLGKLNVLERLAENKVFNVAVQSKRTGETGVHRMLMSLDRALLWKRSPMKAILNVFTKSLRILTDANPRVLTASNCVGDTPFHCLAKVILDCTEELERLNCYEGYFERLVRELTRLTTSGMLATSTARELLLKTNNSKETFLHILACRDGVGHRVIKSVLKNIDPEIMDVLKETVNGDGKTPSDLAKDLCSYDMSAILDPNRPSSPVVDIEELGDEIPRSPENETYSDQPDVEEHRDEIPQSLENETYSDQPEAINSPPPKLFKRLEQQPSPELSSSGVGTAANSRSLAPNIQKLLFGKFEEELAQARRGLEEKEEALVKVRRDIHNAQDKKKRLLQELDECVEEIVQAAREEGSTLAEITAKKRDIERFTAELAKKA